MSSETKAAQQKIPGPQTDVSGDEEMDMMSVTDFAQYKLNTDFII